MSPQIKSEVSLKSPQELEIMRECGKKLREIKNKLSKEVIEGNSASEIEKLANTLIEGSGGKASFKMVPGYKWATCVNVNSGLVHGIPHPGIIFKKGDLVSVDIGLYFKGFHTDTSFSVVIEPDSDTKRFYDVGKEALTRSVGEAKLGKRIWDISKAMEDVITKNGYTPIKALVGHGVGRSLHEEPAVPCFTIGDRLESPEIKKGLVLAIEVMYTSGKPEVLLSDDGWTISTRDGKISGLFEETVIATSSGGVVIT